MSRKDYETGYHDGAMNETKGKKAKIVKLEDEIAKLKAENAIYRQTLEHLYNYHTTMTSLEIDEMLKALEAAK